MSGSARFLKRAILGMESFMFDSEDYLNQEVGLSGMQFNWFAIDGELNVGYFTSGGCGPVPRLANPLEQDYEKLFNYFLHSGVVISDEITMSNDFIETTNYKLLPQFAGMRRKYVEEIMLLAKIGIFCFDSSLDKPRGYSVLASPQNPLKVNALPNAWCELVSMIVLPCRFASSDRLV